jgi:hypothetical protein
MHNQQMFDCYININEIIPKLKRWKGEIYINEVNMFPNGYKLVISFKVNCEQPNGLVHQSNIDHGISSQGWLHTRQSIFWFHRGSFYGGTFKFDIICVEAWLKILKRFI